MVKKHALSIHQEDSSYTVVSLSTSLRDYRLCFLLNKIPGFAFSRTNDFEIKPAEEEPARLHALYTCQKEEEYNTYILIANRSHDAFLVPSLKQADFLLFIEGPFTQVQKKHLITNLRQIPGMLLATEVGGTAMKQFHSLINDLEMHLMKVPKHM